MISSEPQTAYPRDLLYERSLVLAEHAAEREQLPIIEGSLVDGLTVKSHEQGVSIAADGKSAVLSIIDTTTFSAGGAADIHGLINRQTQYDDNSFVVQRLFPDPILYRKLTLDNPDGAPVIAFCFAKEDTGWSLADINRATFKSTALVERAPKGNEKPELQVLEKDLTNSLRKWMRDQEEQFGIGFIADAQYGDFTATSPLRTWSDFKNLKLIRDLYIEHDSSSVLDLPAIKTIGSHLAGIELITDVRDAQEILTVTHDLNDPEARIKKILGVRDIAKYKLSAADFALLCEAILSEDVPTARIVGIASAVGHILIDGGSAHVGGLRVPAKDPEELLITVLQGTDRKESNTMKVRDALHGLATQARDARLAAETGFDGYQKYQQAVMSRQREILMRRNIRRR